MKIVVDDKIPYIRETLAEITPDTVYIKGSEITADDVRDADALIVRTRTRCDEKLLAGSRVKFVATATIGFDHIDTAYCERQGIAWTNAPGCNAASVAQYVLNGLVTLALRTGESLRGKTLGIVGVGHVGSIVVRYAEVMGMRVLRNDPPRAEREGGEGFVSLTQIAAESDVVTLHVPLTKEGAHPTYHLANAAFFGQLAKRPWLINSCRGAVHDTAALLAAKREGLISQLIIDCWEQEPTISRTLLDEASLATPHIAGFSADGKANGTRACLQAIERFFGIHFALLDRVVPPAPPKPLIDLDQWSTHRVEQALLHCFSPERVDAALRANPDGFEWQRNHYDHPREFMAYQVSHATAEEAKQLSALGFQILA